MNSASITTIYSKKKLEHIIDYLRTSSVYGHLPEEHHYYLIKKKL